MIGNCKFKKDLADKLVEEREYHSRYNQWGGVDGIEGAYHANDIESLYKKAQLFFKSHVLYKDLIEKYKNALKLTELPPCKNPACMNCKYAITAFVPKSVCEDCTSESCEKCTAVNWKIETVFLGCAKDIVCEDFTPGEWREWGSHKKKEQG